MPFDATNYADNEVSASGVEVGKLRRLSEALKGEMPPNWRWHFGYVRDETECGFAGCAIGLAHCVGLLEEIPSASDVCTGSNRPFGLRAEEAASVFGGAKHYGFRWLETDRVTPLMVAAAIDRIIARETA